MNLDDAIAMAVEAHRGQVDKAGEPYILHPLRVMMTLRNDGRDTDVQIVGVLHDVIEDSAAFTVERMVSLGLHLYTAIAELTRLNGESYEDYISRCCLHPIARVVKLADIADNLDEGRLSSLDRSVAARLVSKYAPARQRLLEASRWV